MPVEENRGILTEGNIALIKRLKAERRMLVEVMDALQPACAKERAAVTRVYYGEII